MNLFVINIDKRHENYIHLIRHTESCWTQSEGLRWSSAAHTIQYGIIRV